MQTKGSYDYEKILLLVYLNFNVCILFVFIWGMCLENQLTGDVTRFRLCFLAVPSGNETVGVKHIKNAFEVLGNQQPGLVDLDTAKFCIP